MTLWTVACQAPLSLGSSKQEYWSGLPFPSPGDLPNPGMNPGLQHHKQILCQLSYTGSPVNWGETLMVKNPLLYESDNMCTNVLIYVGCLSSAKGIVSSNSKGYT